MHVERPGKEQRWTGRPHAGRRGAKRPVDLLVLAMRVHHCVPHPEVPHSTLGLQALHVFWKPPHVAPY